MLKEVMIVGGIVVIVCVVLINYLHFKKKYVEEIPKKEENRVYKRWVVEDIPVQTREYRVERTDGKIDSITASRAVLNSNEYKFKVYDELYTRSSKIKHSTVQKEMNNHDKTYIQENVICITKEEKIEKKYSVTIDGEVLKVKEGDNPWKTVRWIPNEIISIDEVTSED